MNLATRYETLTKEEKEEIKEQIRKQREEEQVKELMENESQMQ